METLIMEACVGIISVIATAFSGYAVSLIKRQMKEKSATGKGVMILLQSELIDCHEKWTGRGYTTPHGLKNFLEMYDAYKDLGGNGMIDNAKKDVENLPMKG